MPKDKRSGNFLPFEEARKFTRGLNLSGYLEWLPYVKNGKKPKNIPSSPTSVYKNKGWLGWGDFLGNENNWLSFNDAREFARGLNLSDSMKWRPYVKSGKKPRNIPSSPYYIYKNKGWLGWADFLGNKNNWLSFNDAREFARGLNLSGYSEWVLYKKSKPDNMPAHPQVVYKDKGWVSWPYFLGNKKKALKNF